jgi:hypothetical protein
MSKNVLQSAADSLEDTRGTPRYLTGNLPSCLWSSSSNIDFILTKSPEQKNELFAGLDFNPEISSNSNKAVFTCLIEEILASENKIKSSAKHKWVSFNLEHLGWYWKPEPGPVCTSISFVNTSIAITKR